MALELFHGKTITITILTFVNICEFLDLIFFSFGLIFCVAVGNLSGRFIN